MMMSLKQKAVRLAVMSTAHDDFEKVLNAYANFKLSDKAMGEDMVQDTFTKTWSYLLKGGKIHVMKSFLYHVLNNLIIDEYRKRKTTSLDVMIENGFEPSEDESARHVDQLDGAAVLSLIKRLPLKYQKAMNMRYIRDLSLKEMSAETGESKGTIAVHLHRGTMKLRVLYKGVR